MEVRVGLDGDRFVDVETAPSTPDLFVRLAAEGVTLADGQSGEICLALDAWLAEATAPSARGIALLIDYGYPAAELYDPIRRRDGTLRAYVRHTVHDDPYAHIGRQDLTAHVDVDAVVRAASDAGLTHLGTTTQAEFLVGLGMDEHLRAIQTDPATTMEAYLAVRSSVMRLLDPAATGRFRVMAFGRDWPGGAADQTTVPSAGFGYRTPGADSPRRTQPPTRASALLRRIRQNRHASAGRYVRPTRRGAGRELARALGTPRSPTFPRHRSNGPCRARPSGASRPSPLVE